MREGRSFDPAQTKQLLLQNIPKTGLVGKAAVWRLMGNLTQRDPSGESMCAITVGRGKKMKKKRKQKKESIETARLAPVGATDFLVLQ